MFFDPHSMRFTLQAILITVLVACSSPKDDSSRSPHLLRGIHNLSDENRRIIDEADEFNAVKRVSDLPKPVEALCADHHETMADVGGAWRDGCIVDNPPLPSTRLIWACRRDDLFLIHYESGGYVHSYHLMLVRGSEGEAKDLWHAASMDPVRKDNIRQAIRSNALSDFDAFSR